MAKYKDALIRAAKTFVQAGVAAFLVLAPGIWLAPNVNEGKALLIAAVVAAISAGVSAAWNVILTATKPEEPAA